MQLILKVVWKNRHSSEWIASKFHGPLLCSDFWQTESYAKIFFFLNGKLKLLLPHPGFNLGCLIQLEILQSDDLMVISIPFQHTFLLQFALIPAPVCDWFQCTRAVCGFLFFSLGMGHFLYGISDEMKQSHREQLFAVNSDNLVEVSNK